jgi:transcription initiation factor IIE alpha subunit
MIRFFAKIVAKLQYRWRQEVEAASNDLNALLALKTAEDKRAVASRIKVEADKMDARIKEVGELEEKGYWLCRNGHEPTEPLNTGTLPDVVCPVCEGKLQFIKRSEMSGQEKYESDKERNEAQRIADEKRAQAKTQEDSAVESERAAKYFRNLAQSNRNVADEE